MPEFTALTIFEAAGLLGVAMEVGAYGALQLGLLHGNGYLYTLINLIGSIFLLVSLVGEYNVAYFITENVWIILSVYGLTRMFLLDRRARLNPEELAFVARQFPTMSRTMAHSFVSAGSWVNAEAGTRLATEGQPIGALIYLAGGEADILIDGRKIATCPAESFIGELSCFDGSPANADVVLATPARYFKIGTGALNKLCSGDFEMRHAVQSAIGNDTRKKLLEANQMLREVPVG